METEKLYKYLPASIVWLISSLPMHIQRSVNEIRLRRNGALSLSCDGKNIVLKSGGVEYKCSDSDIDETVSYISRSSMYAYESAIKNGYIPLEDGGRAGICGDAVSSGGNITGFGSINSVCLRVPRFIKDTALDLFEYYSQNGLQGTLVFSPPGVGKTTYLKSIAHLLSFEYRVGIADERYELSGGIYKMADICSGCKKRDAIELLTRTMSPQVIVCDEISESEAEGVRSAQNSGAVLVASCHGGSIMQVQNRDFIKKMIENGVFSVGLELYFEQNERKTRIHSL